MMNLKQNIKTDEPVKGIAPSLRK